MQAEFSAEREKLGGAKEELRKREADIQLREEALALEMQKLKEREESQCDYPVPEWLRQHTLEGTLNIGVVGNAGVGKSLLINRLRRIKPHAAGWAAVGVNETTMEPTMYTFRNMAKVRVWDLPGAGTEAFPSDSYIRNMGLRYFDKTIIVTAGRFTSTEVVLRSELREYSVPFFMVRTKVDIDVYNNVQDNGMDEHATLQQIRADMRQSHDVERAYLVSLRDLQAYDYQALVGDLFPAQKGKMDPFAPSFELNAPAWNDTWAMPVAHSAVLTGLQGRWQDNYGVMYHIQGLEAHVTLREGRTGVVLLQEGTDGSVWWTGRWCVDAASIATALVKRELRWAPTDIRQDKPLVWWWFD